MTRGHDPDWAYFSDLARRYDERTSIAVRELARLCTDAERLSARGRQWYDSDPDNVPGLACESIIIKLGENVSRLSSEFTDDHPQIPWRAIKDMRNRLTHYYDGTDYNTVWAAISRNVPDVGRQLATLRQQSL